MEDYHLKYQQQLTSNDLNNLHDTLLEMRLTLKKELDILMYLKNFILTDADMSKYLDIIHKIETLILKEIESIGDFVVTIEKRLIIEIDDKVYNRFDYIRESYNDILLNIQKVIESSTDLLNIRIKFKNGRRNISDIVYKNTCETISNPNRPTSKCENIEMLEKLNTELETMNREKNGLFTEYTTKYENTYNVDKEIELLRTQKKSKKQSTISESKEKIVKKPVKSSNVKKVQQSIENDVSQDYQFNKMTTENMKNLSIETEKIREMCKEIEKALNENCIMDNEKKNLEKLKNEIIRIASEVSNVKDDISEFKKTLCVIIKKLDYLEVENKNLKHHNNNLISYASNYSKPVNNKIFDRVEKTDSNKNEHSIYNTVNECKSKMGKRFLISQKF